MEPLTPRRTGKGLKHTMREYFNFSMLLQIRKGRKGYYVDDDDGNTVL